MIALESLAIYIIEGLPLNYKSNTKQGWSIIYWYITVEIIEFLYLKLQLSILKPFSYSTC